MPDRCRGSNCFGQCDNATANGAQFLRESDRIGTIAPGKQADLGVIKGDSSKKIEDIENVETVFKDGVGI